ncbi:MAG: Holliday junction resolvase RuvX [Lachnospiraceae bacterium]|nr:Holliday junction resolvase RuvX [Lachnospiraceae bacterium]MCR5023431.1 Holliday junction resolvase RuvX [Lachnospiraceae bacterium]
MKYLGLDYGSKTVGVAITDATGSVVREVEIIRRQKENALRRTCARIEEIISSENVEVIVLGLPLNMDGTEGERAEKARLFGDMIARRTGLPVRFQDERLSTVEAYEIMDDENIRNLKDRKARVDSVAAAVILGDFLNRGI